MSSEKCADCALFEFRRNQVDLKKSALTNSEKTLKKTDPITGIVMIGAVMSGIGDRRCSSRITAFGASPCERPNEFRRRY